MKIEITVSKGELLSKLKAVSKVINPSNKVIPAHANFLFEIKEEFDVTGADQSGNITATVDCMFSEPEEKMSFCVDSKTMLDGLRELPEQPINLVFEKNGSVYSTSVLHQSGKYKIQTSDSEGFQVVKNQDATTKLVSIKSVDLLRGIKTVHEFAGTDDLRPIMMGIYIQSQMANLSFCASTGAMMAMLDYAPDGLDFNDFELVMPSKLAKIIIDLVSKETNIELEIGLKNVTVRFEHIKIVYRFVEGKYPNYRSVVPKANDKILIANTNEMNSALRRIFVFAESSKAPVQIHATSNNLNLINISAEVTQFSDENIPANFTEHDFKMGFGIGNLSMCMETITTEEFRMTFSDPTKACLITPDDVNIGLTVLIMPTTINI
jgi:DNA polymerase-3 subunit beta